MESNAPATDALPPVRVRRWPKPLGFLFFLWALLFASVTTSIMAVCAIASIPFEKDGRVTWWFTRTWATWLLAAVGAKVEVRFETPLPEGPVIFACNHQSAFDILALFVALGRRFVFVAKKSVFSYPFLGWYIGAAGYIRVDRGNHADAIRTLERAGERIRDGVSVAAFPEGTRSSDGSILPFKKGPFMVALKAGVPMVPIAIEGALGVHPKRAWRVCPNTIRILVGPPIPTAGVVDRDALMATVRTHVIRLHKRLGGLGGDETNHIAAAGVEGIGRPLTSKDSP